MKSGGGSSAKNRRLAIILGVSISVTSFLIIAVLCWFKRKSRKGMQNLPFYLFLKSFYSFFSAQVSLAYLLHMPILSLLKSIY